MGNPMDEKFLQKMPENFQANEKTLVEFQRACHQLCQRIFEHIAVALDLDRTWFSSRHEFGKPGSSSVFRLLFYPGAKAHEPGVDVRAGAHSDYGSITLLFQQRGQPGLEIKTQKGEWAPVPAEPCSSDGDKQDTLLPILVNIGDLLEDWTGGLLKSTVHRVAFGNEVADRYSMAYFCDPLDDVELVPVPSKRVSNHMEETGKTTRKNGKILTAKDHLLMKLGETLKTEPA
jgi:isopenicillin N synthase-like dioxygenase